MIRDERKSLERQAERHIASMEFLYGLALTLFTGILALGGLLFTYQFGKTKKEMHEEMKHLLKREAESAVAQETSELKDRLRLLKDDVVDLIAYKFRKIAWIAPPSEDEGIGPFVEAMRAFGIANIDRLPAEILGAFQQQAPDLIILSFDGTEHAQSLLRWIVNEIKDKSPPIPLLIFTYGFGGKQHNLGMEEFKILKGYDWYLPANVPATLISHSIALLRQGREKYK